jgi:uncharacterized integral membrane protein
LPALFLLLYFLILCHLFILKGKKAVETEMDDAANMLLMIVSVLLSLLLGALYALLHSINEKISDIKTEIAELRGFIQNTRRR